MKQGQGELALTSLVFNSDTNFTPPRLQTITLINADLPWVSLT